MRPHRIGLLASVALLALAGGHFVGAQGNHPDFLWVPTRISTSVGVTTGELLRLTAFNPSPAGAARARFTLFSPDGTPVQSVGPVEIGPLQTVLLDIPGDDRALDAFREVNGRAQLSVMVELFDPGSFAFTPGRPREPALVAGAELVEEASGKTTATITMKGSRILQN
jgi:hypothetical protein